MLPEDEHVNYGIFRDFLSSTIMQNIALDTPKERRRAKGRQANSKSKGKEIIAADSKSSAIGKSSQDDVTSNDAEDLSEFIDVKKSEHGSYTPHQS